jgi:hypothetical protein
MVDLELFDMYVRFRTELRPYNTDQWDVLWAALCFASRF